MHVDADELLVTTGGQQVIDLVCKTLIDPGDVIVAEGPTYPGAVPTFGAYEADVVQIEMDADGMRIDLLEETLDRLEREGRTPKFIYTVPTFQNPAGVTMSLERRRRLVADRRASASCSCSRTTRTACCATRATRCRRSTRSTAATTSSTSARSRRSSRRACGSAGPRRRGRCSRSSTSASRAPTSARRTFAQHFVDRVLRPARLARPARPRCASSTAAGATRCSTRSPSTSRPRRLDAPGRRPVHLGDAARLHRHDRPARARAARARRVRARAAPRSSTAAAAPRCG